MPNEHLQPTPPQNAGAGSGHLGGARLGVLEGMGVGNGGGVCH